jgi:hypothetical protein
MKVFPDRPQASDNSTRAPEDQVSEDVEAAAEARQAGGLGRPGKAINRRSPFFIGMSAAAGVAVTYGVVELIIRARSVLILIGLALFIAAGCADHGASPPDAALRAPASKPQLRLGQAERPIPHPAAAD